MEKIKAALQSILDETGHGEIRIVITDNRIVLIEKTTKEKV